RPIEVPEVLMPRVSFSAEASAIQFSNGNELSAFYLVDQSGFDRSPPRVALSKGFEILREYTDESGKPIDRIAIGSQGNLRLKFRAIADQAITQVALVDLMPGGFDLVIPPQEPGSGAPASWQCQFCSSTTATSLTFSDPREDRVVFYGSVTHDVQEIVYRIKA